MFPIRQDVQGNEDDILDAQAASTGCIRSTVFYKVGSDYATTKAAFTIYRDGLHYSTVPIWHRRLQEQVQQATGVRDSSQDGAHYVGGHRNGAT